MPDASRATLVLVDERAGGDVYRDARPRLEQLVGPLEVIFADGRGSTTDATRRALARGIERVLVAGSDATVNHALNGFFEEHGEPVRPTAALGLLGEADLAGTIRIANVEAALAAIAGDATRLVDVGRITYRADAGGDAQRLFLNVASVGLFGALFEQAKHYVGLPGRLSWLAAALTGLWVYRNPIVRLRIDDAPPVEGPVAAVAVANGRSFHGGMRIAPDAAIDDGLLHVTTLGDLDKVELLGLVRLIYDGGHVYHPKVEVEVGRSVLLSSDEEVLLEADGELLGRLPGRFEIRPAAVRLIVPREP